MSELTDNTNLDELLSAYIDGELTDDERAQVEARLETDPTARELVAEMRSVSSTLRGLPREKLTEDIRADVLDQIRASKVVLPASRVSLRRRIFWPALAIAAALLLMFIQDAAEHANVEIVKAPGRADEPRAVHRERAIPALEAPAPTRELAEELADKPADDWRMATAEAPIDELDTETENTPREGGSGPDGTIESALDALATENGELGVVHLTLTDVRLGAERFDKVLISNGVQVIDEFVNAAVGHSGLSAERASGSAPEAAGVMSSRAASPTAALGGVRGAAPDSPPQQPPAIDSAQPEMVLVEARPEQIEQILFTCQNDTEAIESVTIDPTASGTNRAPQKQRLFNYQQYARSTKPVEENKFQVTPAQQGVIAVLNSIPNEPADPALGGQLEQGWATKLRIEKSPPDLERVEQVVTERRSQVYNYSQPQSYADLSKKPSKDKAEQPMRVLFLLHSSEAAK